MRLIPCHAFILVVMLSLSPEVTPKSCKVKTNGCSIPLRLPFFYKRRFTPACNKHDVCYSCGIYYWWTRCQCDVAFYRDMKKLCKGTRLKKTCRTFAKIYFKAVQKFGRKNYNECSSPSWCKASCAKRRGNPNKKLSG